MKTAVEAVGATAAVRDCRRAPWLLLLNLAVWQCPTRLVQGWLDVPCRSLQRLQRVVRANPTAERRWGGVGSCTVVIFVTSHANAEAEARKDAGSCCVPVESEDGGNAANSTPGNRRRSCRARGLAALDSKQYRRRRFGVVARLDFCLSSEWAAPHAYGDMGTMHHPCPSTRRRRLCKRTWPPSSGHLYLCSCTFLTQCQSKPSRKWPTCPRKSFDESRDVCIVSSSMRPLWCSSWYPRESSPHRPI